MARRGVSYGLLPGAQISAREVELRATGSRYLATLEDAVKAGRIATPAILLQF